MSVADLIEPVPAAGGACHLPEVENWGQGRTLYGGASALIAYTAAIRAFPDLPPLRSAQIAFVKPISTDVEIRREVVRQGRNVAQVRSEIWSEGGCALTAFWLFGTAREPNALHRPLPLAIDAGDPGTAEDVMSGKGPQFIQQNFALRRAQEQRGRVDQGADPVVRRWAKLTDAEGIDTLSQLVLIGDVLPPGAMRAMQRQGPISSINWTFNVLDPEPATEDGWWLAENASQHADAGYSSERLRLWNSEGRQVLDGMQSVAIFG